MLHQGLRLGQGSTGVAGEGSQPGGSLLHTEELSQWLSWVHRARIGMNILEKVLPCQIWRDDYLSASACLLDTSFRLCLFSSTGQVTLASSWAWPLCMRLSPFCMCPLVFVLFALSSGAEMAALRRWRLPWAGQRLSRILRAKLPLTEPCVPCLPAFSGCALLHSSAVCYCFLAFFIF